MKRIFHNLRPVLLIGLGGLLALLSASMSAATAASIQNNAAAVIGFAQVTETPAPVDVSRAGNTDGIVLMGVIIVVVIIAPILARQVGWMKSKGRARE